IPWNSLDETLYVAPSPVPSRHSPGMSTYKRPAHILELGEAFAISVPKHSMNQSSLINTAPNLDPYQFSSVCCMVVTLRNSMKLLKGYCKTLPALQSVVERLFDALDSVQVFVHDAQRARETESDLVRWVIILSAYLSSVQPGYMSEGIEYLCKVLQEQTDRISIQQALGRMRRTPETEQELDQFKQCFRYIEVALCRLQADLSLNSWRVRDEQARVFKLERMHPVMDALYDSTYQDLIEDGCHSNTRELLLERLSGWAHGLGTENIYWPLR
ncbi:unnamed protein product, partial [Rhizoctonia solani]